MKLHKLLNEMGAHSNLVALSEKHDNLESLWANCVRPYQMLWLDWKFHLLSDSQRRLLACALIRRTPRVNGRLCWSYLDDSGKNAVRLAEGYARGMVGFPEVDEGRLSFMARYQSNNHYKYGKPAYYLVRAIIGCLRTQPHNPVSLAKWDTARLMGYGDGKTTYQEASQEAIRLEGKSAAWCALSETYEALDEMPSKTHSEHYECFVATLDNREIMRVQCDIFRSFKPDFQRHHTIERPKIKCHNSPDTTNQISMIHITPKDRGRKVRLRNGLVHTILAYRPDQKSWPVIIDNGTGLDQMRGSDGYIWGPNNKHELDIVEWADDPSSANLGGYGYYGLFDLSASECGCKCKCKNQSHEWGCP